MIGGYSNLIHPRRRMNFTSGIIAELHMSIIQR